MAYGQMVDLALTPEEQADYGMGMLGERNAGPLYPFGWKICVTDAECAKLNLDPRDVQVGDIIDMRCFGSVTSVSMSQKSDGTSCCRVEVQIEKAAVENENTEYDDSDD